MHFVQIFHLLIKKTFSQRREEAADHVVLRPHPLDPPLSVGARYGTFKFRQRVCFRLRLSVYPSAVCVLFTTAVLTAAALSTAANEQWRSLECKLAGPTPLPSIPFRPIKSEGKGEVFSRLRDVWWPHRHSKIQSTPECAILKIKKNLLLDGLHENLFPQPCCGSRRP